MTESKLLKIFQWEDVEYASGIKRVETLIVKAILETVLEEAEPIQYYKLFKDENTIKLSLDKHFVSGVGLKFKYSENSDKIVFMEYLDDKYTSFRKTAIEGLNLTSWRSADDLGTSQWKLLLKAILNDHYRAYED